MKLNAEQRQSVEDNHKLIYWFASLKGLDVEEWYGLLAIELCDTVRTYDSNKGSLSNYYKLKAERMMINEFAKQGRMKRTHNGIYELNDVNHPHDTTDMDGDIKLKDFIGADDTGILELKMMGFTQSEIADKIGVSQASVSRTLNKMKEEYEL